MTSSEDTAPAAPRGLVVRGLRWVHGAVSSPTATILIAIIFLLGPAKFALSQVTKVQAEPTIAGFPNCESSHKIRSGDTPATVSSLYFGDPSYSWAILIATNMKNGSPPFAFVRNPAALQVGSRLCIPSDSDADTLRERYDAYLQAGRDAMVVEPVAPPHALITLTPEKPIKLVTWSRANGPLSGAAPQPTPAPIKLADEIWVTVAPELKQFCQRFVREHAPDPAELALRLEQRLGLLPGSNNVIFVTFEIVDSNPYSPDHIFRPCSDSSTNHSCPPQPVPTADYVSSAPAPSAVARSGPPSASSGRPPAGPSASSEVEKPTPTEPNRWFWFLKKYYSSHGDASKYQYPWTAAGYTFDWAKEDEDSDQFVKWGESEFVVTSGTSVHVLSSTDTVSFCEPE